MIDTIDPALHPYEFARLGGIFTSYTIVLEWLEAFERIHWERCNLATDES